MSDKTDPYSLSFRESEEDRATRKAQATASETLLTSKRTAEALERIERLLEDSHAPVSGHADHSVDSWVSILAYMSELYKTSGAPVEDLPVHSVDDSHENKVYDSLGNVFTEEDVKQALSEFNIPSSIWLPQILVWKNSYVAIQIDPCRFKKVKKVAGGEGGDRCICRATDGTHYLA